MNSSSEQLRNAGFYASRRPGRDVGIEQDARGSEGWRPEAATPSQKRPIAELAGLGKEESFRGGTLSPTVGPQSGRSKTCQILTSCAKGHPLHQTLPHISSMLAPQSGWESFLDGRLNQVYCERCQTWQVVESETEFLDPWRGLFVTVLAPSKVKQWASLESEVPSRLTRALERHSLAKDSPYVMRLVFGLQDLRKKLALWEAGLDDSLIEVVRLQALQSQGGGQARNASGDRAIPELTCVDLQRSRLSLSMGLGGDGQPKALHLPLQQYEILVQRRAGLEQQLPALFKAPFVDVRRYLTRA